MPRPRTLPESWRIERATHLGQTLQRAAQEADDTHWQVRTALYQAAQDLAKSFRSERDELLTAYRSQPGVNGIYTPLVFNAQGIGHGLELVWRLEHRWRKPHDRKSATTTAYIRRTAAGYDLRSLEALALPFERQLVIETELAARSIRAIWSENVRLGLLSRSYRNFVAEPVGPEPGTIDSESVPLIPSSAAR